MLGRHQEQGRALNKLRGGLVGILVLANFGVPGWITG